MFGQSLLSAFGSAACTTDTDQLFATDVQTTSLATYQFNNATTSIPSNTYPGTPSNITYAAGKFGNAAVFNGSSSEISLGTIGFGATSQITISMWLNPNSSQVAYNQIIDRNHNTLGGWVIQQGTSTNQYYFALQEGSPFKVSSTISLTANVWSHLVFTINASGNLNAYLNNVQVITGDTGYGSLNNSLNLETIISGYAGSSGRHFNGSIDQLRIFNSALPQAAVTALYNETTTTATYPYVDYVNANPNSVAYYKMSDATDQLGNYNGTATNVNFNTVGKFGFAGAFNGSSSKILLPNSSFQTAAFTISAWCDVTANGSENSIFEFTDTNSGNNQSVILLSAGSTSKSSRFLFRNRTSNEYSYGPSGTPLSGWNHYCMTFDGSTVKSYINGSQVNSASFSITNTIASTSEVLLGLSAGDRFLNGKIDQIRIYNSAASAANVTALYNEIECPAVAVTNAFNTVLYTGNGGTQAVTGVGFKPDFTWIKQRTDTFFHILQDSVRGAGKTLFSNATNAESGNANDLISSFDTNGFTVNTNYNGTTNNDSTNKNNFTYVAWNWKAPLANLSTGFNGSSSIITLPTALSDGTTTVANCISFWFNVGAEVTSSTTNNEIMTFSYSGGSSGKISLGSTSGSISNETFSVTSDVTTQYTYSRTNIPAGWNHAVVQWNSGTTKWDIYINGVAHTTYTFGTNEQGNWALKFGQRSSFYFNGSLNQIRLFNSILSASEISDLYAEPLESNNTLNYPAGAGCIAAYPLQTDAVDLSGNYNGTPSNVTFGQPGYLTQNTEGTITSTVAANVDAGFSIVKYTGNNSYGQTVGHGLSAAPELVIIKNLDNARNWRTYAEPLGATKYINLDDSAAEGTYGSFNNTAPTTTVFSTTSSVADRATNFNGDDYIAYCFHSVDGFSRVGSYIGTGGAFTVYTGFAPSFVMIKRSDSTANWVIIDNKRGGTSRARLYPNLSNAEDNNQGDTLTSNGFSPRTTPTADTNINGGTFIYLAIA